MLYWRKLIREAGWDHTDIERLTKDRKGWKTKTMKRMEHLQKWEEQKGHRYEWGQDEERLERDVRRDIDLICRYDGCGREFRNKGGLTLHQKRTHRAAAERVTFVCDLCNKSLETMTAKINHEKTCDGGRDIDDGRRECGTCNERVTKSNYARHRKKCTGEGLRAEDEEDRVGRKARCQYCGRWLSYANMARHERVCLVWDPGGGPNPI